MSVKVTQMLRVSCGVNLRGDWFFKLLNIFNIFFRLIFVVFTLTEKDVRNLQSCLFSVHQNSS